MHADNNSFTGPLILGTFEKLVPGHFHRKEKKIRTKRTKLFVYGSSIVVQTKAKLLKGRLAH